MKSRTVYQVDDYKTLPATFVMAKVTETIPAFGSGKAQIEYVDPDFSDPPYKYSIECLNNASTNSSYARQAVSGWGMHQGQLGYFLQFCDDPQGDRLKSFHSHTELVSAILESRLGISPAPLWDAFEHLLKFKFVQEGYRKDDDRETNYNVHAKKLEELEQKHVERGKTVIIVGRAIQQIETRANGWSKLAPIHVVRQSTRPSEVTLFYSYSHIDEALRDELEKHLSILQRNGFIRQWHDRRIGPGEEWKGAIDEHLRIADLILLLISSDFLASDYCYDVELEVAMNRHDAGEAKVIPVFIRPCDWEGSPFGKLQGLPTDAKPVTSWHDRDEAFTSIARGIRDTVNKIRDT